MKYGAAGFVLLVCLVSRPLLAADVFTVLVAPKSSNAYANAKAMESAGSVLGAERRLHRAFKSAAKKLEECGDCAVHIKIAAGIYAGKGGTGTWNFPDIAAPGATLRILGGYDDDFELRNPFETPTVLRISPDRSGPVIQFEGRKHALKELALSGLVIDVGPSNAYDARSNSLLKGGSSTWPILSFGYITTDRLIIADNVFMNAPHSVGGPRIRSMSDKSEVIVRNNLFYNNVFTWGVASGGGKHKTARYLFDRNSFVLNWPFNPDKSTSDPGTVIIGNRDVSSMVVFKGNLFAYNAGGALHPKWDDDAGPPMEISGNLFWANGAMYEPGSEDDGVVVGKFNGAAVNAIYSLEDIEDDFEWELDGNVAADPELGLEVLRLKSVTYADVLRGVTGGAAADDSPVDELDALNKELEALLAVSLDGEGAETAGTTGSGRTGGRDFDEYMSESGVTDAEGAIANYAPYIGFSPGSIPLPLSPEMTGYGIDPGNIQQYQGN